MSAEDEVKCEWPDAECRSGRIWVGNRGFLNWHPIGKTWEEAAEWVRQQKRYEDNRRKSNSELGSNRGEDI